jgi:hypothetical protein
MRDDIVGDFADDHARSPLSRVSSMKELFAELREIGAHRDVLRAAWHAWREWRRGGRPTRLVRRMRKELSDVIRTNKDDGRCVWVKRGFWADGQFWPFAA